jgi:hypothetical protein
MSAMGRKLTLGWILTRQRDWRWQNFYNVNVRQREQVERIINHSSTSSRAVLAFRLVEIKGKFSLAGRLGSGALMTTAVQEHLKHLRSWRPPCSDGFGLVKPICPS